MTISRQPLIAQHTDFGTVLRRKIPLQRAQEQPNRANTKRFTALQRYPTLQEFKITFEWIADFCNTISDQKYINTQDKGSLRLPTCSR